MDDKTQELLDRTFWFGVNVLKFLDNLPRKPHFDVIRYQLAKSATSIGANYEEAQAAESRDDFIHKIGVVLKETRESHYWLRVIKALYPDPEGQKALADFLNEAEEFKRIFTSIRMTAQQRRGKR